MIDLQTYHLRPPQTLPHQLKTTYTLIPPIVNLHGIETQRVIVALICGGQNVCDDALLICVNIVVSKKLRPDLEIEDFFDPSQ